MILIIVQPCGTTVVRIYRVLKCMYQCVQYDDKSSYKCGFRKNKLVIFRCRFSSALCYCTEEILSSCGRPSSVVRPSSVCPPVCHSSVKPIFLKTIRQINAKFWEKYLSTIFANHLLLFFKI